ncbi:hypothetical protein [Lachnoclostridium sp.]|uniref:hypothetical protein n=1 Tax=Lachnoclostridium sp. TaxID=2028282 RepID=UPI00289C96B1|nr:hypothetical protein [Lachnoclostridium sp.]
MERTTREDILVYDMVHNNPGLAPYETQYNSPEFLKKRGYDGQVFDIFQCAQFGITWDYLDSKNPEREKVYLEGSKERIWALEKQQELKKKYQAAKKIGLNVMFMMDIIVLPLRIKEIYSEILNESGKIDIKKAETKEILDSLFNEMFHVFPEIDGIYIRFGETYVGEKFNTPYHFGNNPILDSAEEYHIFLIQYLQEKVCNEYKRNIYYRSWGFGAFQFDPAYYLKISNSIEVNPKFYFCIKHTAGDFHRTFPFNQCLNIGKHKQVIEIQAAREYEGKGAYPNYIGDGVINGYEEFKWMMKENEAQCLKDVINLPDSLIAGVWTWSRGGGWDGPYINGKNGRNGEVVVAAGCELWPDANAYVILKWTKDTSHSEKYYALQYAEMELHMSHKDAEIFYEILLLSEKAVLLGRGTNTVKYDWDVFWTRDQNIEYSRMLSNIESARKTECLDLMLNERKRSVDLWKNIVCLAESLSESVEKKAYILTTCKYGFYLYSLYEVMYRGNALALEGGHKKEVASAIEEYEELWEKWKQLYETEEGCPTLYEKDDKFLDLMGYDWNKGFDSAINPIRKLDIEGNILPENRIEISKEGTWGLTGKGLN